MFEILEGMKALVDELDVNFNELKEKLGIG